MYFPAILSAVLFGFIAQAEEQGHKPRAASKHTHSFGGASWCTFNDDCLGWSDKKITKDCCAAVKHKAYFDEPNEICRSRGGFLFAGVDHVGMYNCCVRERKAVRMCGLVLPFSRFLSLYLKEDSLLMIAFNRCQTSAKFVKTRPRKVTYEEFVHYNLTDRPKPRGKLVSAPHLDHKIPFGDKFMNTIMDAHFPERENGTRVRVPDNVDLAHADYQKRCQKPMEDKY
jgi:hypothetical protein